LALPWSRKGWSRGSARPEARLDQCRNIDVASHVAQSQQARAHGGEIAQRRATQRTAGSMRRDLVALRSGKRIVNPRRNVIDPWTLRPYRFVHTSIPA
jgi:hypothetical protein